MIDPARKERGARRDLGVPRRWMAALYALCGMLVVGVVAGGAQIATCTVEYLKFDRNKSTFVGIGNKGSAKTGQAQFLWSGSKQ